MIAQKAPDSTGPDSPGGIQQKSNMLSSPGSGLHQPLPKDGTLLGEIVRVMEKKFGDENFALPQLCREIGISRSHLFRKMKKLTGVSPSHFIRSFRLKKAKCLLNTTYLNVFQVSWMVGFKDTSHFSRSYFDEFGVWPSRNRQNLTE